ncbi:MAG: translocation/assembly module TamB domain-containing protein [Rhodothermales bacterium]
MKRWLRHSVRALGVVIGMIVLLVLFASTRPGTRWIVGAVLDRLSLYGATVSADAIDGRLPTHLTLIGSRFGLPGAEPFVAVDTLRVWYALWPLLRREVRLEEVEAIGWKLNVRQEAGGAWDLIALFPEDTTSSRISVSIDAATLAGGAVTASVYSPDRDSIYRMRDVTIASHGLRFGDALGLRLDTLHADLVFPDTTRQVALRASATLRDDLFTLGGLHLASDRSLVEGAGTLRLSVAERPLDQATFSLSARPIAFDDIRLFAPSLAPGGEATIDLLATSDAGEIRGEASVVFPDGGRIDASALARPYPDDLLQYQADAVVQHLDPGLFAGDSLRGRVDARLSVDLQGPHLDSLNGEARLDITRLQVGDLEIGRSLAFARFIAGMAEATIQTGLGDGLLAFAGVVRPFDQTPTYQLAGRVDRFDVADLQLASDWRSNLSLVFQASGSGFDPATASSLLELDFEPSTINDSRTGTGRLSLQLDDGNLDFSTSLLAGTGRIDARGALGFRAPYRVRVEEGSFDNVDVAALFGDTTRNVVRGRFSAEATGRTAEELTLAARLALHDSYYGSYYTEEATLDLALERGEATYKLDGRMQGGDVQLAGTVRPFDAEPTYAVDEGRLVDVDLGALLGRPDLDTRLTAALTGEGRRFASPAIRARLDFDPSRFNRQTIDHARATLDLGGDSLAVDLSVDTPAGEQRARVDMRRDGDVWQYRLEGERIEGLDLGAWMGRDAWTTDLNGHFAALGRGFELASMDLSGELALRSSTVNGESLEEVSVELDMRAGAGDASARVRFGQGRAEARARLRGVGGARPSYAVSGSLASFDLASIAGLDTLASRLTGTFRVDGAGRDIGAMQLAGAVDLGASAFGGIDIQAGRGRFRVDDGVIQIDTLRLATSAFDLEGQGGVLLPERAERPAHELVLTAQMKDIAPLRRFLDVETLGIQRGEVTARLVSRPADYRLESRVVLSGLVYESVRVADAQARWVAGMSTAGRVENSDLFGDIAVLSVPGLVVEDIHFEGTLQDERLPFVIDARMDSRRRAHLAGTVYTEADSQRVDLEALDITLNGDAWALDRTATVSYGRTYRVRNFLLESGDQQIAIDGLIDLNGEQNLGMSIDAFRVGSVAGLLGYEGLSGRLTGNLDLRGPAASPRVVSNLNMTVGSRGEPVGDLALIARYDSLRLQLDVLMKHQDESTFSLNGYVPANFALVSDARDQVGVRSEIADGPVELNARADSFAIGWILPFVDREFVDRLEGTLTTRLRVEGTAAEPVLQGEGRVRLSRVRAPFLGVSYSDVGVDFTTRDNVIYIEDVHARTGDGRVDAAGVLAMSSITEGTFEVDISAREFLAVDSRQYRAVASATLQLGGTLAHPALSGDVNLRSGDIFLDAWTSEDTTEVVFTQDDLLMLERTFGVRVTEKDTTSFDLYEAMSMDIDVSMDRDIWLRSKINPEMNIQFTGNLDLTKEPAKEQTIFGAIEVVPERSYIKEFGKRFAIRKGTLSFNGPATSPVMDIEARYEVPNQRSQENAVTINLDAEGQPDALNLTLSSEPSMELTDIISYIATGQPASEALLLGGSSNSSFASAGRGFAVSQGVGLLTSAIEDLVNKSGLELDVIQIETSASGRGATVTAGKYVTPKVYTSVSQPIGGADSGGATREIGTIVTLELQLMNSLLLRLLGGESTVQINLLWQHAY